MAANNKKNETEQMAAQEQPRPNRDAYKQAFSEDYPDMDFEDKEARYGRMLEDRSQLRSYRESGSRLNKMLDNNRWLAVVLQELANNPDTNPIEVMAQSGIDINEVMKDEETRQKVSDKLAAYQQKQLEDEQENEQRQKNFENSAKALKSIGVSDDEATELWNSFFTDIVDQALMGVVTAETWNMLMKAKNYDADIKTAKEEAAMRARNEKLQNNVKDWGQNLPPSLSQATNQAAAAKRKRGSFFSGLSEAGY